MGEKGDIVELEDELWKGGAWVRGVCNYNGWMRGCVLSVSGFFEWAEMLEAEQGLLFRADI